MQHVATNEGGGLTSNTPPPFGHSYKLPNPDRICFVSTDTRFILKAILQIIT